MSTAKVRVGVIGLGGMAGQHFRWLKQIADRAFVEAICDVDETLLARVGEEQNVSKKYRDFAAIIHDPDVDCILSIVPNKFHAPVLEMCMAAGKPCMSEKPFTLNLAEAERLAERHARSPVPVMIGFSYRYVPSFRYARERVARGEIGAIRHVQVQYLQQWGAEPFDTLHSWRYSKEMAGTGALGDLGTHMIDAVRFIVGEIESVTAMLKTFVPERRTPDGGTAPVDVDDYAAFMAQFADGAVGTFVTTRNAIGFGNHLEVTLFGSEGTFRVNCERPDTIQVWKPVWNESGFEEQRVPESYRLNQLEHFLQYVAGDAEADDVPVLEDGYRNQLVLERIMESAQSGRSVQVIPS